MSKVIIAKPIIIQLFGYPGSGKTNFATELANATNLVHLYAEKISQEFFGKPYADNKQNTDKLVTMLAEEFLGAGLGVILDVDSSKARERKKVREFAIKNKAKSLVVWFQLDQETAFSRKSRIDRRKSENKYETTISYSDFMDNIKAMQNPINEDYVVVSGKHTFRTQKAAILKRLFDLGITGHAETQANLVKPGLVNLVPQANLGGSRNISIR